MKPAVQEKKTKKRKRFLFIALAIILLSIIGWLSYLALRPAPTYPLGDRLEYLGEAKYGCYGFCDSLPGSTYYYGTDMSAKEIMDYFEKATAIQEPQTVDNETYFGIKTPSGEAIYTYLYQSREALPIAVESLKPSNRTNILELPASKYRAAKDSL